MGVEVPPAVGSFLGRVSLANPVAAVEGTGRLALALGAVVAILLTSIILKLHHGLKAVSHIPGFRIPFSPYTAWAHLLPVTWWNPGMKFLWEGRKNRNLYNRFGSDHFSLTPWLSGDPLIITSNLDVLRQVAFGSLRTDFKKADEMSRALLFWGQNLVVADGDRWKRHRRIVNPAFNTKLYERVWSKTIETYEQMIEAEGWRDKDSIDVDVVQRLTHQFTLLIISVCGFGLNFDWAEPPSPPDSSMSVQQALKIVVERNLAVIFLPRWVHKIVPTTYFREINEAVVQMHKFMRAQVASRQEIVRAGGANSSDIDAFTLMVKANEEGDAKLKLDEKELIGNVFVLMFAGHETTALTLAAALAYLSINPEIQDEVHENILEVVGRSRVPAFEDYGKLDKVLAVFLEVLRLYPSGHLMFREATRDTTLNLPRPLGEEGVDTIHVPKGTITVIDMVGLQYNPRYFENPESFKPSRWYGTSKESQDAFTAFSIGPRECLGRKFATVESVCFLALLLRDFKLEPLLLKGETLNAWKNRVLDVTDITLTLGLNDASIRFVRRKKGASA